jgi:predicted nucleic acid-binding protein
VPGGFPVKFLLDVNALLAWRHARAPHHGRFHAWAARQGYSALATCALAELGFIRVSLQVFGYSLQDAQAPLAEMKQVAGGFVKTAPSPGLPAWSASATKTSDGYLMQVADSAGLTLATFDPGIPAPRELIT